MNPIIAFDFSCSKPALCSYIDGNIEYAVFPASIDGISKSKLENASINIYDRGLEPLSKNGTLSSSEIIKEQVIRAANLADMITNYCIKILKEKGYKPADCIIAHEGLSFGSTGNAVLDLSGYKYVLMYRMMQSGFERFATYAPITIKKTAGCSKKGAGKEDMIQAAGKNAEHPFNRIISESPMELKKKTAWVSCVDDLCDAYWCMKTCIEKEF